MNIGQLTQRMQADPDFRAKMKRMTARAVTTSLADDRPIYSELVMEMVLALLESEAGHQEVRTDPKSNQLQAGSAEDPARTSEVRYQEKYERLLNAARLFSQSVDHDHVSPNINLAFLDALEND